ncbi:hypothetical protein PS655_04037 [Pseudomonas fluorescens]|uniref:Uncharacterized protein n=1 Tax=Pseudomonas fluorescens TaxID=294 RepID=A0A5E6VI71_PSEFL|nr:hypothetical protein PS655_04037 [Pseudomonas fluorescens]
MGIARKPAIHSSSGPGPTVANSPRKRGSGVLSDDSPANKNTRLGEQQVQESASHQPEMPPATVTASSIVPTEVMPVRSAVESLEHYRLKSPASLPAADTQGLRLIKGRHYVDIAPGEIVQVRQTATTGEYRATLVSELVPSGPPLYFDAQSRIWKLEMARSAADDDNVTGIEIDERIRDARNDRIDKQRVHVGSDDAFERGTALGSTLFARGLKEFTAEQAKLIRSELRQVEDIFYDAGQAIDLKLQKADQVFESFFGSDHRAVTAQFADSVSRGLALSREYQGVWGEAKFLGVNSNDNAAAWMYKRDFHGRLFLNRKFMQPGLLCMSLGHEMLHTNRIDRFKSIGPNAGDFFYVKNHLRDLLGADSTETYEVSERVVSEMIMHGGLTVEYLKAFGDDHDSFLFYISDYLGLGDDLDLHSAVELFNVHPQMRAQMAVNNADSLVFAAKSLQALYRSATGHERLPTTGND